MLALTIVLQQLKVSVWNACPNNNKLICLTTLYHIYFYKVCLSARCNGAALRDLAQTVALKIT